MYYPKYTHFTHQSQYHDLTKLRCSNGKLITGSFIQSYSHYTEILVVISDTNLTVIDITGNEFIVFPTS